MMKYRVAAYSHQGEIVTAIGGRTFTHGALVSHYSSGRIFSKSTNDIIKRRNDKLNSLTKEALFSLNDLNSPHKRVILKV